MAKRQYQHTSKQSKKKYASSVLTFVVAVVALVTSLLYNNPHEATSESESAIVTESTELPAATSAPAEPTADGGRNPRLLEMPQTHEGELIVRHTGYVLSYNSETNCPNWVAWELTRSEAKARGNRNPDFYADPSVERRSQVTTEDYIGSGYTRGHMCPSADMRWSTKAQHDCFYMTNMCPQKKELNAESWEWLENSCRRWAIQEGSVYIVCGPVFNAGRKVRTIGRDHKVRVPDGFFKVVLSLKHGDEKAIGFYYANNDREQTMESASLTVDEVESLTGFDFFYQVDKAVEERVEKSCNLRAWD